MIGRATARLDRRVDACPRRRDDRQSVRNASGVEGLDVIDGAHCGIVNINALRWRSPPPFSSDNLRGSTPAASGADRTGATAAARTSVSCVEDETRLARPRVYQHQRETDASRNDERVQRSPKASVWAKSAGVPPVCRNMTVSAGSISSRRTWSIKPANALPVYTGSRRMASV